MPRPDRIILCTLLMCCAFILQTPAYAADDKETGNSCVRCHSHLPGSSFVGAKSHGWTGSIHQKHGVTCNKCHGGNPLAPEQKEAHAGVLSSSNPGSPVYFKNIPSTCGKCHEAEFYKFTQSLHYKRLESTGKGPECVTCHGSMVTSISTPDTIADVCERCHNERMNVFPYVPQKAKAVLLLLTVSSALLDAGTTLYHPAAGTEHSRAVRDARSSLHSARLDWHKFDLDTIIGDLQDTYNSLKKLAPESPHR
jgi:Cytochrome c7 and related cytochrome c